MVQNNYQWNLRVQIATFRNAIESALDPNMNSMNWYDVQSMSDILQAMKRSNIK